jgi:hypothetical protein
MTRYPQLAGIQNTQLLAVPGILAAAYSNGSLHTG